MTDRSFQLANDESRARLARLVATLTPRQLAVDLGEGWTVASVLGHMGFWDRWQAARWEQTLAGDWQADSASVKAAECLANDALHPYWARAAAADLGALALEAATRLDALVSAVPDSLVDQLEGSPFAYLLHRHRHRGEHLDHIERGLAAADAGLPVVAAPVDRGFVERNAAARRRLASLAERLRDSDMQLPTEEGGWTAAQVLAHVAFWDRSNTARWRAALAAAEQGQPLDPVGIPYALLDGLTPPLIEMVGAWSGRLGTAVANEALAAAEEADALIESVAAIVPDTLIAEKPNLVNRWNHREAHVEQVERALAAGRPGAAAVDGSYLARNEASLERLRKALDGLTAADLALASGEGSWTVGQILGHLTFWDRFLAERWEAALAAGPGEQPSTMPHELADLINGGLPPTWLAFASAAPEAAIAETLAAAEAIDRLIAGLPPETPVAAILAERPALLDRSIHRFEHLDQVERALRA
jgi:uncharacterized damage-inducible protein DinB